MRIVFSVIVFFFLFITPIYGAESSIIEAEGNACMRDYKSRKQTEQAAVIDAKRRAVEFVSTYIKSETNVKNFELQEDILSTYANAEVKIIKELEKAWYKDAASDDCYKIKIKAQIIPCTKTVETKYANYEVQERCGVRADQLFKDQFSMHNGYEFSIARYKSHYNGKLNKCIMYLEIIATKGIMQGKKDDQLIDVNEKNSLGSCTFAPDFGPQCFINSPDDIKSVTATEWLAFVRKVMGE